MMANQNGGSSRHIINISCIVMWRSNPALILENDAQITTHPAVGWKCDVGSATHQQRAAPSWAAPTCLSARWMQWDQQRAGTRVHACHTACTWTCHRRMSTCVHPPKGRLASGWGGTGSPCTFHSTRPGGRSSPATQSRNKHSVCHLL